MQGVIPGLSKLRLVPVSVSVSLCDDAFATSDPPCGDELSLREEMSEDNSIISLSASDVSLPGTASCDDNSTGQRSVGSGREDWCENDEFIGFEFEDRNENDDTSSVLHLLHEGSVCSPYDDDYPSHYRIIFFPIHQLVA